MATLPPIERWDQVPNPRAAVHIVHGITEYGRRYGRFARALNAAGFIVWAHDHRGHGNNPAPGVCGHFADDGGWRALIDDAWAVSDDLRGAWPRLPVVLFAHSMGSFVGQALAAEHGAAYRAVILCGTNGSPLAEESALRAIAKLQAKSLGKQARGVWLEKIVFEWTYNRPFGPPQNSWLSSDPTEVEKYNNDGDIVKPTSQAWLDLLDGRAAQGTVEFFRKIPSTLPLLVIAGKRDPVGEFANGVERLLQEFAAVGLTNVTSHFYDDARHELVNEKDHKKVTDDVINWIAGVI
jgi:alpha-beta hydrolase superfamily lysophospholipase